MSAPCLTLRVLTATEAAQRSKARLGYVAVRGAVGSRPCTVPVLSDRDLPGGLTSLPPGPLAFLHDRSALCESLLRITCPTVGWVWVGAYIAYERGQISSTALRDMFARTVR